MIGEKSELKTTVLGKACHLVVANASGKGQDHLDIALAELQRLELKFSSYQASSVVSQINQRAGSTTFTELDPESRSLFQYVDAVWSESRHLFDPTTRVLSDCYATGLQGQELLSQLGERLPLVGWSRLEFNEQGVRLPEPGMAIDLNTCIRPYALDRTRRLLSSHDVGSALISLDTDVVTLGKQPDGSNWLIGVRHPLGNRTTITRLKLNQKGYSIKGSFENTLMLGNEVFSRALSPIDGQPVPGLLSVAVVADNCLDACSAACIARLKTEQAAVKWLDGLGLKWMAINRQMQPLGPLAPAT